MENTQQVNEYDLEPVSYCPKCYSLKIGYIPGIEDSDYCMECGCLDVVTGNIFDWERLYENRYGHKYVKKTKRTEGHPVWNLSPNDLRKMLVESRYSRDIIKEIYPDWNIKGSIVDTVYLFIDEILKDGYLPRLKKIMIARYQCGML